MNGTKRYSSLKLGAILLLIGMAAMTERGFGQSEFEILASSGYSEADDPMSTGILQVQNRDNRQPVRMMPFPQDLILNPTGGLQLSVGVLGGLVRNAHYGEFTLTDGAIECCRFDEGSGWGAAGAVRFEMTPNDEQPWRFAGRIGVQQDGGRFLSDVEELPVLGQNNELERGEFQNELTISTTSIDLTPMVMFRLLDSKLDLYLSAGPTVGYSVAATQSVRERIIAPVELEYLDGSREKLRQDLPVSLVRSTHVSATGGLDLRMPVSPAISLAAEVYYRYGITPFGEDADLKMNSIIGSIGVMYTIGL